MEQKTLLSAVARVGLRGVEVLVAVLWQGVP